MDRRHRYWEPLLVRNERQDGQDGQDGLARDCRSAECRAKVTPDSFLI